MCHGGFQNPTVGYFDFQLRLEGVDLTTKALPKFLALISPLWRARMVASGACALMSGECPNAVGQSVRLGYFLGFLFLFDGDADEGCRSCNCKQRSQALLAH